MTNFTKWTVWLAVRTSTMKIQSITLYRYQAEKKYNRNTYSKGTERAHYKGPIILQQCCLQWKDEKARLQWLDITYLEHLLPLIVLNSPINRTQDDQRPIHITRPWLQPCSVSLLLIMEHQRCWNFLLSENATLSILAFLCLDLNGLKLEQKHQTVQTAQHSKFLQSDKFLKRPSLA